MEVGTMTRIRLPNRRPGETIGFEFRGAAYTATFSRFPDGRLAELFIDAAKPSNDAADDARDAAVAMSIALQHGTPLEAIRAALTRDGVGRPAGILGAALGAIADEIGGQGA
jgi:hypothetical protein